MINNTTKGFTLIELLLVIALIAAMTVSGVAFYRQRTTQLKIEKTSLQMQQWLQAAMAYYVDNGAWPADASALLEDPSNPAVSYYLPDSIKTNPWGYDYSIEPIQDNRLIKVSVNVPDYDQGEPLAYAQRIAARLPNADASLVASKPLISAEVNIPGEVSNSGTKIIGIYKIPVPVASDYKVPKPSEQQCPTATMTANVYYSLAALKNINVVGHQAFSIGSIDSEPGIDQWKPNLNVQMFRGPKHNAGTLIAIVTCEPKTPLIKSVSTQAATPFIF